MEQLLILLILASVLAVAGALFGVDSRDHTV